MMAFFQRKTFSAQSHNSLAMQSPKKCCKKTLWGVFAISFLGCLLGLTSAGLSFYRYTQLTSCRNKIDFMIQNKTLFLSIMQTQMCIRWIASNITTLRTRTKTINFGEWLEKRFIAHLKNNNIKTVKDLPWADRSVIRILDSSQKLSRYAQNGIEKLLYALTFYYPSS